MERIRRPIRVAVVFEPGNRIVPKWFELDRCKHEVCETTYQWRDWAGKALRLHFAVSDGQALYELVYHTGDQSWSLVAMEAT